MKNTVIQADRPMCKVSNWPNGEDLLDCRTKREMGFPTEKGLE